jgi:hypothetical protein
VFDYKDLTAEEKKQAIYSAYDMVRKNPLLIAYSINTLTKKKTTLRQKAANH